MKTLFKSCLASLIFSLPAFADNPKTLRFCAKDGVRTKTAGIYPDNAYAATVKSCDGFSVSETFFKEFSSLIKHADQNAKLKLDYLADTKKILITFERESSILNESYIDRSRMLLEKCFAGINNDELRTALNKAISDGIDGNDPNNADIVNKATQAAILMDNYLTSASCKGNEQTGVIFPAKIATENALRAFIAGVEHPEFSTGNFFMTLDKVLGKPFLFSKNGLWVNVQFDITRDILLKGQQTLTLKKDIHDKLAPRTFNTMFDFFVAAKAAQPQLDINALRTLAKTCSGNSVDVIFAPFNLQSCLQKLSISPTYFQMGQDIGVAYEVAP